MTSGNSIEDESMPINWHEGKMLFGPIRKGQRWKKRDTGRVMEVYAGKKNNSFMVHFQSDSRGKITHTLKERDIYKFYILL